MAQTPCLVKNKIFIKIRLFKNNKKIVKMKNEVIQKLTMVKEVLLLDMKSSVGSKCWHSIVKSILLNLFQIYITYNVGRWLPITISRPNQQRKNKINEITVILK